MKILFIKLSAIGDVVQTLPALEAIKKIYLNYREERGRTI
jgi:ADP-heptose:LPS heptosyltransferase